MYQEQFLQQCTEQIIERKLLRVKELKTTGTKKILCEYLILKLECLPYFQITLLQNISQIRTQSAFINR
jgi:hypothetical protein